MEVEAKFTLTDEAFQQLLATTRIGAYTLCGQAAKQIRDTYLDTADRRLFAAGYACRQRQRRQGRQVVVTLKGLGSATGAIHRREEFEASLPAPAPPQDWPAGLLSARLLGLVGNAALGILVEIHQERTTRLARRDDVDVAEVCLDRWWIATEGERGTRLEVEVELLPGGTDEDIVALAGALASDWGLAPETQSKFQRALAVIDQQGDGDPLLTSYERAVCEQIAEGTDKHARRARALLALDDGLTQSDAGARAGLSERRVRYWLAAYRRDALGIFAPRVLERVAPAELPEAEQRDSVAAPTVPEAEASSAESDAKAPGISADQLMVEAAHRTLLYHFRRMLRHEAGTRAGEDIEELHDMRVATRRMRAAFRVFDDHLDPDSVTSFVKGLRRTGRVLGAVRDLDVFWEKTERWSKSLPSGAEPDLGPLRAVWERQRALARDAMIDYLDSDRYARFRDTFGAFLETADAGKLAIFDGESPRPHRVRHVVPVLLYQRLASVQAYDGWVVSPSVPMERLHQLRIAAKMLRYTVEFFEEVLSSEARDAIRLVKGLQDHLGDLQDAVVASGLLRDFLTWGTWGHETTGKLAAPPAEPILAPGVATYLAARQTELQRLLDTFPEAWTRIQDASFRTLLSASIAAL